MAQQACLPVFQALGAATHTLSTKLSTRAGDKLCIPLYTTRVCAVFAQHGASFLWGRAPNPQTACPATADLAHFATALSRYTPR